MKRIVEKGKKLERKKLIRKIARKKKKIRERKRESTRNVDKKKEFNKIKTNFHIFIKTESLLKVIIVY